MTEEIALHEEELSALSEGQKVLGYFFRPENIEAPLPAVIISHGFGANGTRTSGMARTFSQRGFAAVALDFRGARESRSEGGPEVRSVLSEKADLEAMLDVLRGRPEVDASRVYLLGISEGGCVSALAAAKNAVKVAAMALVFPALCIADDARERFFYKEEIPEFYDIMDVTVGRRYGVDAHGLNILESIQGYDGPVQIVHGDADEVVPVSYSIRAAKLYTNCTLHIIEGGNHGMRGPWGPDYARLTDEFLLRQAFGE